MNGSRVFLLIGVGLIFAGFFDDETNMVYIGLSFLAITLVIKVFKRD